MTPTVSASPDQQLDLLQPQVRGLILDIDGVLWKDAEPIGELATIFRAIRLKGLRVAVATNNAMNTVQDYRLKLRGFGVELEREQVVTSGEATADTLAADLPRGGRIFAVGERGLVQALESRGFEVVTDPQQDCECAAVAVGLDRQLTYAKIQKAASLIRAGAAFYGTNPDVTFPTPEGLVPGAGAVLAAVAAASGRQPTVIGKPAPLLFEIATRRMGLEPKDVLIVGDRLETDIAGAQAFGARSALVLSGVSTQAQANAWRPPPTLVASTLSTLLGI